MRKIFYLLLSGIMLSAGDLFAQEILPGITVKNFNGKIIVSWRNQYPLEVRTINIQRSFDSLKNFSTIGTVLTPQNAENGFVDETPPYNKMYYRVFISFEGGAYIFTDPVRPVKEALPPLPLFTQETVVDPFKKPDAVKQPLKETRKETESKITLTEEKKTEPVEKEEKPLGKKNKKPVKQPVSKTKGKNKQVSESNRGDETATLPVKEEPVTYPSRRIYTGRDNNIVISLPNPDSKRYVVKFFDEEDKFMFELNRIKENFLIVEKVNFLHAGWFYFELFENGKLIEKNKFFIPRDGKSQ